MLVLGTPKNTAVRSKHACSVDYQAGVPKIRRLGRHINRSGDEFTREDLMTDEDRAKFWAEFGPRRDALLDRLQKAAGVSKGPMSQGDLEVLAAASMELLTMAIANMPEPRRGEITRGLSTTMAADVAQKREQLEQKIPGRRLDTPKGSA
jgi:hypothetical protein